MKFIKYLKLMSQLGKFRITFATGFSSVIGYILVSSHLDMNLLCLVLSIFVLSAGCSALNQYQERTADSLMKRTSKRPIPSGLIKPASALIISSIEIIAALAFLYSMFGLIVFILGLFAFLWYNFAYTYLKKVTSLAVVPGALIGAIPPAMGWAAAGGNMSDPLLYLICLFFFIWQIPHFWLLMMFYSEDYKLAGFPVIDDIIGRKAAMFITFSLIICLSAAGMMILLLEPIVYQFTGMILLAASLILIWDARKLVRKISDRITYRRIFVEVNAYVLLIVLFLSLDKLLRF